MITVKKIIKRILEGKYSELEANILITKHYKNEYFDSFYSEFKSRTILILNEFMFELSDAEILRIIEDVNEFNEKNNFNSKIDIPKVYVSYQDEWDKIKVFYKKIDKYEFIFNVQGLDEKPLKTNYYKSLIFLNKLITNYITHNNFRYGFGYSIEKLNKLQYYPVLLDLIKTLETPPPKESDAEHTEAIKKLKTIWLAEPKISVEDFIQKGVNKGLWNENLKIITSRGSLYGTGKTLLSSIYFAFKDWAISSNTDYNEVGKAFCEAFNIEIKKATIEKYKAFSSGKPKIITEIKRTFGVK